MNEDFDSNYGSGFAGGGSFNNSGHGYGQPTDYGNNNGSYGQSTDYGNNNGSYGQSTDYGNNNSGYGQSTDYGNNNSGYGQSTDYGNNNGGYGQSTDYGSSYGQSVNTSPMRYSDNAGGNMGGQGNNGTSFTNQEPDYDPNEPFYKPELDYDPNAPLYRPDPSESSSISSPVTTLTQVRSQNQKLIVIVAIIMVVAVVGGVLVWKFFFEKQTIKQYVESPHGQAEVVKLKSEFMAKNPDTLDFSVFAEGDDKLVYEVKYDIYGVAVKEKQALDTAMEALKPSMQSLIKRIMNQNKLKQFSVVFRHKNKTGTVLAEYVFEA